MPYYRSEEDPDAHSIRVQLLGGLYDGKVLYVPTLEKEIIMADTPQVEIKGIASSEVATDVDQELVRIPKIYYDYAYPGDGYYIFKLRGI